MKELIKLDVRTRRVDVSKCKVDLLAVGMFRNAKKLDGLCRALDAQLGGAINRVIKLGDFNGKEASSTVLYTNGQVAADRVLLVGLGEKNKATLDTLRKAAANAADTAINMKVKSLGLALHRALGGKAESSRAGRAMAEGAYFGGYRYDEFVTSDEEPRPGRLDVTIVDSDAGRIRKLGQGLQVGVIIGKAQSYARTLSNRPGNVINPATLADEAKKTARTTAGLNCTVLDEKQLAARQMGGILAVGSGSKNPPRLIVLKYNNAGKKPAIALVGKAITFDSGGISIKPSKGMQDMKFDKAGGIVVLATMRAIAELKVKLNVYGIIPAAENLPSGISFRPGDIIKTYSGKTVEVQNTDAEGRMILADALAYAAELKCDPIVDIATLTMACMIALGRHYGGLMGNNERLIKQLQKAGKDSGEKVWPMPTGDEYTQEMKSKIADLKNVGPRWGGACTAAAFLGQFVADAGWTHIDIDGDMFASGETFERTGSRGFGVRLLSTFLIMLAEKKGF